MDNVFEAPPTEEPTPSDRSDSAANEKPTGDPMEIATATLNDLKQNIAAYLKCGLSYLTVALFIIGIAVGAIGFAIAPGMINNDEDLLTIGFFVGFAIYTATLLGFGFILSPLMMASTIRAADAHLDGQEPLSFGSPFSRMRERAGTIILYYAVMQLLTVVGMLFLYLPGLVVAAVTQFAFPIVVLEDVSFREAISRGFTHFKDNLAWHAVVWIVFLLIFLVAEFSFVGLLIIWPFVSVYTVTAYRQVYR